MTDTAMTQTDFNALYASTRDAAFKKIIGQVAEFGAAAEAEAAVFYQQFVEAIDERTEARQGIVDLMARNEQLRADLAAAEDTIARLTKNSVENMLVANDESLPPA